MDFVKAKQILAKASIHKKTAPVSRSSFEFSASNYFFFAAAFLRFSSIAAWAAAKRATGTR